MTIPVNGLFSINIIALVKHDMALNSDAFHVLSLHQRDANGRNALFWAIRNFNQHNVEMLIEQGISLSVDGKRTNALFFAIECDNFEAIRYLIQKGIDPNISDNDHKTLLMYAAQYNRLQICRLLIEEEANPYLMDRFCKMAIDYAKSPEIVEFLENLD